MNVFNTTVYCPPLAYKESDHSTFSHFLDIVSYFNVLVNTYTMYCIIFRSTKYMHRYKWFLFYHQFIAFVCDMTVSLNIIITTEEFKVGILIKPLVLVPFAGGYPLGPLQDVVPTVHLTAIVFCIICLSVGTVTHLFTFRYTAAQGKQSIPFKFRAIIVFFVVISLLPGSGTEIAFKEETKKKMQEKYTCITEELTSTPGFLILDRLRFGIFVAIPIVFHTGSFTVAAHWFIIATKKFINSHTISEKLRKMQRRFLQQVIIQAFVPLAIIVVPATVLVITVVAELFGLEFIGLVTMASMSLFGLSGALVLIIMNPTYHWWLTPVIRRFTTKEGARNVVVIVPQKHTTSRG